MLIATVRWVVVMVMEGSCRAVAPTDVIVTDAAAAAPGVVVQNIFNEGVFRRGTRRGVRE